MNSDEEMDHDVSDEEMEQDESVEEVRKKVRFNRYYAN
jgi:hypothetical protein